MGGKRRLDLFSTESHTPIPMLDGHDGDGGIREDLHELGTMAVESRAHLGYRAHHGPTFARHALDHTRHLPIEV